eukprot:TRINITY_DN1073_c0_g1_i1.p1 TRINITY_DN1073_c0_g1~~TRINITY_DN1073_c0_g1_i1.p1  ORF type:complete len:629 (+),score=193.19 TRINITY_DN1073_c0_g1_i1:70-1956(+)
MQALGDPAGLEGLLQSKAIDPVQFEGMGMPSMDGPGGGPDQFNIEDLGEADGPEDDYHFVPDAKTGDKQDITKDQKVRKECLAEGKGAGGPTEGCRVFCNVAGWVLDGEGARGVQFLSGAEQRHEIGAGGWPRGLEKGVRSMRKGERCILRVDPEYGYADMGDEDLKVPAGAQLEYEVELTRWEKDEDISPNFANDGSIMKTIRVTSDDDSYARPKYESRVTIDVVGSTSPDLSQPFLEKRAWEVTLGDEELTAGMEVCVESMQAQEEALFRLKPQHAYGSAGLPPHVPPGAEVYFFIKLLDFEKVPEKWEIKGPEKLLAGKLRREQGNELYKAKHLRRAGRKYAKAVELLEDEYDLSDEQKAEAKALRVPCLTNLAAVQLALGDMHEVVKHCGKALELEPNNTKALLRRGKALNALNDWDAAKADLGRVLELDPGNADAPKEMAKLRKKVREQEMKDRNVFGNMFAKMAQMKEKDDSRKTPLDRHADCCGGKVGEAVRPCSAPFPESVPRDLYVTVRIENMPGDFSGHYTLVDGLRCRGEPMWRRVGEAEQGAWRLFSDPHKRWKLGNVDEIEHGFGYVKAQEPHGELLPHQQTKWLRVGESSEPDWVPDVAVRISTEPTGPDAGEQ